MGYFCGYPHFYPAKVILFCDIDKYFYDRLCFFRKLPTSFGSTIGYLWDIYGLSVAVLGRSFNHSQVDCGLRDHFATTVAHLWAKCALSMGEMLADGTLRNHFVTTAMFIGRYLEKGYFFRNPMESISWASFVVNNSAPILFK